jgi:hypothetical protein
MRPSIFVMLAFAIVLGVWSHMPLAVQGLSNHFVASVSAFQGQPGGTVAQDKPSGKLDVDININKGNSGNAGRWYANPMWIAIGALAVILVLVLIVMIGRGGGTTVVRG